MGCRNPFRISIDSKTGFVYWGEVGPDAAADTDRGPVGYDEINQARGPGNFGWPYFVADNKAYADYDFATKSLGKQFDPAKPVNDSPNSTGLESLMFAADSMCLIAAPSLPVPRNWVESICSLMAPALCTREMCSR